MVGTISGFILETFIFDIPAGLDMQDGLTLIAILVAVSSGYFAEQWKRFAQRTSLIIVDEEAVCTPQIDLNSQPTFLSGQNKVLTAFRIPIKNTGDYIARSVEASIEEVYFEGKKRTSFISMPLVWTHGSSRRDIYPNQTVYLDLLYERDNPALVHTDICFAVGAGQDIELLSRPEVGGDSVIVVKIYQITGDVLSVNLLIERDLSIVNPVRSIKVVKRVD